MASLQYPFTIQNGSLLLSEGLRELKEKIIFLLSTDRGTRVMNMDFGIDSRVFDTNASFPEAEINITQQIQKYFPEVQGVEVSTDYSDTDNGKVKVNLIISTAEGIIPAFSIEL